MTTNEDKTYAAYYRIPIRDYNRFYLGSNSPLKHEARKVFIMSAQTGSDQWKAWQHLVNFAQLQALKESKPNTPTAEINRKAVSIIESEWNFKYHLPQSCSPLRKDKGYKGYKNPYCFAYKVYRAKKEGKRPPPYPGSKQRKPPPRKEKSPPRPKVSAGFEGGCMTVLCAFGITSKVDFARWIRDYHPDKCKLRHSEAECKAREEIFKRAYPKLKKCIEKEGQFCTKQ